MGDEGTEVLRVVGYVVCGLFAVDCAVCVEAAGERWDLGVGVGWKGRVGCCVGGGVVCVC